MISGPATPEPGRRSRARPPEEAALCTAQAAALGLPGSGS
jgi:hypothetical protein